MKTVIRCITIVGKCKANPSSRYRTNKEGSVYYNSGKMQGKPKFAVKHNRRKENLSLYLIDKPRTPAERQQNKETLELAMRIRAEREQEFKENMLGYRLKKGLLISWITFKPISTAIPRKIFAWCKLRLAVSKTS